MKYDNLETIEKRIQVYNEQTSPVIDFYIAEKTHAPIPGIGTMDAISALTGAIAMINCLGPALGELRPANNFSVLTDFQTWVCSFAMIMGRVELFPVLVIFTPAFWRK